jgi:hypothetical protein
LICSAFSGKASARSGPEDLRLGGRELFVCQRARGVQLCEVLDLVGRVRRRRRILRLALALVLALVLVLVVVFRLLIRSISGPVVSYRRSARYSYNERPAPYPSPHSHGKLLSVRLSITCRVSSTHRRTVIPQSG